MQSAKKPSPNQCHPDFRACRAALHLIPALMFSALFVTTVQARKLIDPELESSSTLFGYSVAVDGDGVPDLAVGAPFQDEDFDGAPGFGPPQKCGKGFHCAVKLTQGRRKKCAEEQA